MGGFGSNTLLSSQALVLWGCEAHNTQNVWGGRYEGHWDGWNQSIFNMQRGKGRERGGYRESLARRKEDMSKRRGGWRVGSREWVKVGGFTVSHSWHHLDCGVLWRKLREGEREERHIIQRQGSNSGGSCNKITSIKYTLLFVKKIIQAE